MNGFNGPVPVLEEVKFSDGFVSVSLSRYKELIRAEVEREILFRAYQNMFPYNMGPVMDAVFHPENKYNPEVSHPLCEGVD